MGFIVYISNFIIPFTILYIVALGVINKVKVYECFTKGARDGLKVVAEICPTLIGLMVGVGILRSSGFLTMIGNVL
ncbi:MAG: spore maturation protein, partial [Lachnospiraceae bacterium]